MKLGFEGLWTSFFQTSHNNWQYEILQSDTGFDDLDFIEGHKVSRKPEILQPFCQRVLSQSIHNMVCSWNKWFVEAHSCKVWQDSFKGDNLVPQFIVWTKTWNVGLC